MIRLGLVGCGVWGSRYPRAAWETGLADVTHVHRLSVMPGRDVVVVGSVRALLESSVQAIVVATMPNGRAEICEEILAAGRPLLVEKPLALSVAEAERIARTAEKAGVPWLVAHQHLFAPAYEEICGSVWGMRDLAVVSHAGGPGPERSFSALWDYGPHDVAMFAGLVADPVEVEDVHVEDPGTFELSLGAGLHYGAVRVTNRAKRKHRTFEVSASDGRVLQYDDGREPGEKLLVDGVARKTSRELPLTRMVRAFATAVRTGRVDWRFGEFGVGVVRVLAEADKMAKKGSHVYDQDSDLRQVLG